MHNLMPSPIVVPVITAGAYSANDVVGGLLTFQLAPEAPAGVNPASGFVRVVTISDDDNEKAALELHLFREAPTVIADNAAFAPTFADLKKRVGSVVIAAGDYVTINSNGHADVFGHVRPGDCPHRVPRLMAAHPVEGEAT